MYAAIWSFKKTIQLLGEAFLLILRISFSLNNMVKPLKQVNKNAQGKQSPYSCETKKSFYVTLMPRQKLIATISATRNFIVRIVPTYQQLRYKWTMQIHRESIVESAIIKHTTSPYVCFSNTFEQQHRYRQFTEISSLLR